MAGSRSRFRLTFWPVQVVSWSAFGAVSILGTLPLSDRTRIDAYYTAVTVSGFLATIFLRFLYRGLERRNLSAPVLVAVVIAICYAIAVPESLFALFFEWVIRFRTLRPQLPPGFLSIAFSNTVFGWVLLTAWSTLYFGIRQWRHSQLREEKLLMLEAMAQKAQLRALRYQITPHLLFNTLNSISTLVGEGNTRDARDMIALLGDFLRTTLVVTDTEDISLSREMQHMQQYLAIEQIRLGDRLDLRISIDAAAQDALVPSLLLQPLVENAIRHGVARCISGGILSMDAIRLQDTVRITIANTTQAESPKPPSSFGMGLRNTADRLAARYGDASRIDISTGDPAQWTVTLIIPVQGGAAQ